MITAQQAADQAAELKHIRQELAYIARALSPWIGRSGKLQLLELCKMFGWSDPKMAMIYFNPSADDLANKL